MSRLSIAPGEGRLVRRWDAILFIAAEAWDPTVWQEVVDRFWAASTATDARDVVTAAVTDAGFTLDPFVVVSWDEGLDVLMMGDIAVVTDVASHPHLSGAGSDAWVEQRVAHLPASTRVEAGDPADPHTHLGNGVVRAGGFVLCLESGEGGEPPAATGAVS